MAKNKKLKNGQLGVDLTEEPVIWKDRKRTFLGLPWSFTRYSVTPSKLILDRGFINRRVDEIRLYRIRDISYHQTFGEKLFGVGCIKLISTDASVPELILEKVKNSRKVKDVISQLIETARRENGVRTSELMGNAGGHSLEGNLPDENTESFGPQIFPDFDHDGVDDRMQ